jgi:uncharacterized protein YcfJ
MKEKNLPIKKLLIMKRLLIIVAIASIVLAACTSRSRTGNEATGNLKYEDTVGLAQFQDWKALNERKDPNLYYGNNPYSNSSVATRYTRRTASRPVYRTKSVSSETQHPAKVKKGWSKAAKGAVIGGTVGAATGVIINKRNRAVGGVIGAVLGGGLGYEIGRQMDKKDGRN